MPYFFNKTVIAALVLLGVGMLALFYGYRARRSSAKRFRYAMLLAFTLVGVGALIYAWEVMSPLTAEKIVRIERGKSTLPLDINSMIRWESIEAGGQRVTYVYTLAKSPRSFADRLTLISGLRQQITEYLCADRLYRAALKQQIAFEFVYRFADDTSPPVSLAPGECAG